MPPDHAADAREVLLAGADQAPVIALVIGAGGRVTWANRAARAAFQIDPGRLPAGFLEVTREARLEEAVRAGASGTDVRLTHRPMTVRLSLAEPLPGTGQLVFLTDVTLLRRLETVRQEFVANLSHELRTPLTSLRVSVESLTIDMPADDRARFARRALQDVDHVIRMVENLRQLAEIESGRLDIRTEPIAIGELVHEVASRLELEPRLRVDAAFDLTVRSDRSKLSQVLTNVLENAGKFSPPGSPLEVAATEAGGTVTIAVRDRGPGLSPEHWERVFERFYKVDAARNRQSGGSGLGLAIAKHLVMALGGTIWTRAALDGGQVFGISLPQRLTGD